MIGGPRVSHSQNRDTGHAGDVSRLNDPVRIRLGSTCVSSKTPNRKRFSSKSTGPSLSRQSGGIEAIRSGISAINQKQGTSYSFEFAVLNAAHFGVPQMRERLFIVGARDGTQFKFPAPTHGDPESGLEPFRTVGMHSRSAQIADVSSLRLQGKWADL